MGEEEEEARREGIEAHRSRSGDIFGRAREPCRTISRVAQGELGGKVGGVEWWEPYLSRRGRKGRKEEGGGREEVS